MSAGASPGKRREMDVMKLMMSDWKVELVNDNISEFNVLFKGPTDSPYEGGYWRVHVELPDGYPYKSPSIGFTNRIYHPNVDEMAGSVCLDVINQTWSPMFDLVNVFEVFLPQLLLYPNPTDPLNGEAAALLMREPETYKKKVRDYVMRYAKKDDAMPKHSMGGADSDGSDDGSDADEKGFLSSSEDEEDPAAGHLDRRGLAFAIRQLVPDPGAGLHIGRYEETSLALHRNVYDPICVSRVCIKVNLTLRLDVKVVVCRAH